MKLNKKGFSLIELMVVVAIIAILASFAIPQYQNFQGKTRQKEGLMLLNSYYVSAKATEAEGGSIFGNFEATGFNPSGQIHYRVVSQDGTINPISGPNNDSCVTTASTCTNGFSDWAEVTQAASGSYYANASASGAGACAAFTNSSNGVFNACAHANIRSGSTTDVDTWRINQAKALTNTNDGL